MDKITGKSLFHFENSLNSGLYPTITPELGADLVDFLSEDSLFLNKIPSSLEVFLTHAPLVLNYWNSLKAIYKILESRILELSPNSYSSDQGDLIRDCLINNLAIIMHRLEHRDECTSCRKKYFQSKHCKNPCEQWPGGIRYTKRFLEYEDQNSKELKYIDKVILEKKLQRIEGILDADIVIEDFQGFKLTSLLLLTKTNEPSQDLQTFLLLHKLSESNLLDTEHYGLPKFDTVKTYSYFEKGNPWSKRRSSFINNSANLNTRFREKYPFIAGFVTRTEPSVKTINYMRRRCIRLLNRLQNNNPKDYIALSMNYLEKLTSPRVKNLSKLWLLNEIIFPKSSNIVHSKHGRGDIRYLNNFLLKEHDQFPCKDDWQLMLKRIKPLLTQSSQYLCVAEFFTKIWEHSDNPHKNENLELPKKTYERYLQSSSSFLVGFAFHQLQMNLKFIRSLHPASIARGLATLDIQKAQYYFEVICNEISQKSYDVWLLRFIYELDDAIHSLMVNKNHIGDLARGIRLGLLALRFQWPGVLYGNFSQRNQPTFNTPFQWDNKIPLSIWSKSKWKTPNTSRANFGLLGWRHSIFDKFLLDHLHELGDPSCPSKYPELKSINIEHYLVLADPERLLDLLSFKVPLLRCHGRSIRLSDANEYNLPPHLKKELKRLNEDLDNGKYVDIFNNEHDPQEDLNHFLSNLGSRMLTAMEGHFTPSDLRHESCMLCRSDRDNHDHFTPFILQNVDHAYQWRRDENGWTKDIVLQQFKKNFSSSFWTKIHKFSDHFLKLECPQWFAEAILLELNQRIQKNILEKSFHFKVSKLTTNAIRNGDVKFLLQLLKTNIAISENVALAALLDAENYEWQQTLNGGANLPIGKVTSEPWLRELWKKLGGNDTTLKSIVQDRFINNPVFSDVIIKNFLPDFNSIKSDEQTNYVINLLEHNPDHFLKNVSDHLKLCLSSDQVLSEKAIKLKVQHGMDAIFALNLLESNSPLGERYAMEYFNSVAQDDADFEDNLMMICDSPNKHSTEFGLELLTKHQLALNMPKMLLMLKENRHKNIKLFVASYLANNNNRFINTSDFDIGILRTRNTERYTKELVKKRLSTQIKNKSKTPDMLFKALKELSYGLIQSDKEWALKRLTLLGMDKHQIPEIIIKDIEETKNESYASISTK